MNIRVDLDIPIKDGTEIVFRSPVDCSQITGLIVYYQDGGNTSSKVFAFADAHGNNVGNIDNLFAENVVVKVILDLNTSMAFVQNADTNAYLEERLAKALSYEKQELTDEQKAQARENIGAADDAVESLFAFPGSVITTNEETLARYDSNDGLTFIYEGDGFTAKQSKYLNYNYGFVFPTEVGEEYVISLKIENATKYPRVRVASNFNYPNKPNVDSDDFLLVALTNDGTGKFTGRFTATLKEAELNFYQNWDILNLTVTDISCTKANATAQVKEESLPKGSKTHYGVLKVGDGLKVEDGVISAVSNYEVVTPGVYAINGAGNFELFNNGIVNSNLADTEYTVCSQWMNVFKEDSCGAKGKLTINTEAGTTGTQRAELRIVDKVGNMIDIPQGLTVRFANMPTITNKLNILFIGDSLVASNEYVREFGNLMENFGLREKMEFLGRQFDTDKWDTTSRYEAVGGYGWPNYVNNPTTLPAAYPYNYFWNPASNTLDIAYYFNTYCAGKAPDYIVCNVGWNQRVNYEYYRNFGFDDIEEMCKRWINAVHSAYPNCRIILNGIHYGNPDYPYPTFDYRKWAIQLTALYNKIASEYSFVRYCDIAPYFDGRTGMPTAVRKVNRFVDTEETHITDYIHPNTIGYKMHSFADAMCLLYDYATK